MAIAIPGYDQVESEVLYDTQNVTSGQSTDLTYFTRAASGTVTIDLTNMLEASKLPANEEYGAKAFETIIAIACPPEDLAQVYNFGYLEIVANRRIPFSLAIRFLPSGAAPNGIDNRSAAAGQAGVQWYSHGRLFKLAKSLRFPLGTNFKAVLRFGTAPNLVATRSLTVGLHGVRSSAAEA